MKRSWTPISLLAVGLIVAWGEPLAAQDDAPARLAEFGERMVGTWESADSRHVFEWGVGRLAIRTRSYFEDGPRWRLVSEGFWYWDPTARAIRGVSVAVDMPVALFEYTSRIQGDEIVHDLVTHGDMAGRYVERWIFQGDAYAWTLEQGGARLAAGRYLKAP